MLTVQYRCQYREYWYDYGEDCYDMAQALELAYTLVAAGRQVRIIQDGMFIVWRSL